MSDPVKALTGSLLNLAAGGDGQTTGPFTFTTGADETPYAWISAVTPTAISPKPVVTLDKNSATNSAKWTVTNVSTLSGGATLGYIKSDETKAYLACRGDLAAGIQLCVVASKDDAHQFVIRPIVPASTNYVIACADLGPGKESLYVEISTDRTSISLELRDDLKSQYWVIAAPTA